MYAQKDTQTHTHGFLQSQKNRFEQIDKNNLFLSSHQQV